MSCSPAETMAGVSWASNETELRWEADFQRSLFFPVAYGVAFVLGLVGNALALLLLCRRARPASGRHVYLINLALADALLAGALPLRIHSHLHGGRWIFGGAACGLAGTLLRADVHLGVGLLACLCLDRYVAALHPFARLRMGAGRCLLVAAALWLLALGVAVPRALLDRGGAGNATACSEDSPPAGAAALEAALPCGLVLAGWPLLAGGICRAGRGARRRRRREALRTLGVVLAVWASCFLPYHLGLLPRCPGGLRPVPERSFSALLCGMRKVAPALVSLGCCKTPLLYYCSSSGKRWNIGFGLRFRSKKVFTICDRSFGQPSCDYKLQQTRGSKKPGDGVNWSALTPRGL